MDPVNIDSFALCLNPSCRLKPKFFNDIKTTILHARCPATMLVDLQAELKNQEMIKLFSVDHE